MVIKASVGGRFASVGLSAFFSCAHERMDWVVIHVRYRDLECGLNAKAVPTSRHRRGGVRTTVYLQPGLTASQRSAALRRLRHEASRGYGPALPMPQLIIALGVDRTRGAYKNATSIIRLHPAGSLVPAAVTGTLMALFVLVSVTARIMHLPIVGGSVDPQAGSPVQALVPGSSASAGGPHAGGGFGGRGSLGPGGQGSSLTPASGGGTELGTAELATPVTSPAAASRVPIPLSGRLSGADPVHPPVPAQGPVCRSGRRPGRFRRRLACRPGPQGPV